MELFGFNFGGDSSDSVENKLQEETKAYKVPEDRAIGRPHMMGWLDLLGDDEELTGANKEEFEADKWEEVKA